ncbi:MAG: FAD-dependent thymidylate synthase, partial [Dehalococcoidia bacterium]
EGAPRDEGRAQVARELARMNLSLNFYTQWYWKTDLHNLMHFLRLRADAHAQFEIRAYADVMADVLERWTPMTHRAFVDYRLGSAQISKTGMEAVRRLLAGEQVTAKDVGMSAGEWRELVALLGISDR